MRVALPNRWDQAGRAVRIVSGHAPDPRQGSWQEESKHEEQRSDDQSRKDTGTGRFPTTGLTLMVAPAAMRGPLELCAKLLALGTVKA